MPHPSPTRSRAPRLPRHIAGLLALNLALSSCVIHLHLPFFHRKRVVTGIPAAADIGPNGLPMPITGQRLGVVKVIGAGDRFVLIEVPTALFNVALIDGQPLVTHGVGGSVALRVSHERRPPFVVADVVSGVPRVGDEVFFDAPPAPAENSTGGGVPLRSAASSPAPATTVLPKSPGTPPTPAPTP